MDYLAETETPRLLLVGSPALGPNVDTLPFYEAAIPGLQTAVVGDAVTNPSFHFLQEDAPVALGQELNGFYQTATVPEPSCIGLMFVGLLAAGTFRNRRN